MDLPNQLITIRTEQPHDAGAVRDINRRAFDGNEEADLVDRLRDSCPDAVAHVALKNDVLVGHILFTPVVIQAPDHQLSGMGLAPMAVLPEYQRQGIGSMLVKSGVQAVRAAKSPFVVVLGHPEYYPRFGFKRASSFGITCEFDVPDEMFMILILDERQTFAPASVAKYHPEFDAWK